MPRVLSMMRPATQGRLRGAIVAHVETAAGRDEFLGLGLKTGCRGGIEIGFAAHVAHLGRHVAEHDDRAVAFENLGRGAGFGRSLLADHTLHVRAVFSASNRAATNRRSARRR